MRKKGDWLKCPKCHKKTRVKVYDNTTLVHFPLYCHWCVNVNENLSQVLTNI